MIWTSMRDVDEDVEAGIPMAVRSGAQVLLTPDGVRLSARHDAPAPTASAGLGFVLAHGFTLDSGREHVRALVRVLQETGGVISFDFRGHGASTGLSTVGDLETLDLAAAVGWARALGYSRVVTAGWSMGASVAIRQAALAGGVDAVVSVSGPSRWHFRGTAPMRLLHRAVETRLGRAVLAVGFGTRVASSGWLPPPEPPDAVAGRIAPAPLLIVHGDADRYFPIEHARWLARAAGPTATLWEEPGFGHAETAAAPELVARIAAWADAATRPGERLGEGGTSARMSAETSARMPT